ncbi:MAG: biotin-dependent carboxyltransferase family protein [Cellvibrionaceae bacterium]
MSLEIVKSGFLTLLQDYGRYGYQRLGVTSGGPIDEHAFLWANHLLGNNPNDTVLEISYGGFKAVAKHDGMTSICGADLCAKINNKAVMPWRTHFIRKGDTIEFTSPKSGMRAYLAIKGGFLAPQQLLSTSTVVRERIGGLKKDGGKIQDNDVVGYIESHENLVKSVPKKFIPQYSNKMNVRFIPNFSETGIDKETLDRFTSQSYKVTQSIDRMGYRLAGEPVHTKNAGIISQGIAMGSIQLPKDGNPIVLMRDRQTIGGYPFVGCVSHLDLSLLSQALPDTMVSFIPVDISEVEPELILHKKFFRVPF